MGVMLECTGCHRFVHATESSCPFCDVPLQLTSAAGVARLPLAFVAGLSLFACTDSNDEAGESNAVTTDPGSTAGTESASTTGDGDGDMQETLDYSSAGDYGG